MVELSWFMVFPICLTAVCNVTEYRLMDVMKFPRRNTLLPVILSLLMNFVIIAVWSAALLPLWSFYILIYGARFLICYCGREFKKSDLFYINFKYVIIIALHLIIIAAAALIKAEPMAQLLLEPYWCAVSIAVCIIISLLTDLFILKTGFIIDTFTGGDEIAEAGSFMTFSWFSIGSLLIDSLLCGGNQELVYTPLFLIGSSAILLFLQFLFLWNIRSFSVRDRLMSENVRLEAELNVKNDSAGMLRNLTNKDALTGAYSRRFMMDYLQELLSQDDSFSLVYLDLDHLKQINDQEGHDAGDCYLQEFVRLMKNRLRTEDILARVGGDEFIILIPNCRELTAKQRMIKIRTAIAEGTQSRKFSFSFGVTEREAGDARTAEILIREADGRMYLDKKRTC